VSTDEAIPLLPADHLFFATEGRVKKVRLALSHRVARRHLRPHARRGACCAPERDEL
jgi:hypothetical protein